MPPASSYSCCTINRISLLFHRCNWHSHSTSPCSLLFNQTLIAASGSSLLAVGSMPAHTFCVRSAALIQVHCPLASNRGFCTAQINRLNIIHATPRDQNANPLTINSTPPTAQLYAHSSQPYTSVAIPTASVAQRSPAINSYHLQHTDVATRHSAPPAAVHFTSCNKPPKEWHGTLC